MTEAIIILIILVLIMVFLTNQISKLAHEIRQIIANATGINSYGTKFVSVRHFHDFTFENLYDEILHLNTRNNFKTLTLENDKFKSRLNVLCFQFSNSIFYSYETKDLINSDNGFLCWNSSYLEVLKSLSIFEKYKLENDKVKENSILLFKSLNFKNFNDGVQENKLIPNLDILKVKLWMNFLDFYKDVDQNAVEMKKIGQNLLNDLNEYSGNTNLFIEALILLKQK